MRVFGFAGQSGNGKTTVMEKVIPIIRARGFVVSVIKHTHHAVDVDQPGKDSWRHRQAGAHEVLLASDARWVLMHELRGASEPELPELLACLSPCHLVLVEGYKRQPIPKIEIHRGAAGRSLLYPDDPHIVAVVTDTKPETSLPVFGLEDYAAIAAFILRQVDLPAGRAG